MSRRPDPWQCPSPCEQRLQVWIASEGLLGYRDGLQTLGKRLRPARGNIAQISFFCVATGRPMGCRLRCVLRVIKKSRFVITEHTSVTFRTNDLRKAIPMVRASTSD